MQIIKGKDFNIYIDKNGTPVRVCNATDFTLRRVRQTIEITGPQGLDQDFLIATKGYTITISGVITYLDGYSFIDLETAFDNGSRLTWTGRDRLDGGVVHSGVMILTNIDWASPVRGDFTFETSALGCGPKTTIKLPIPSTVYLANQNKIRLFGCPDPYPVLIHWYDANGNMSDSVVGVALNQDEVITLFNNYANNEYYSVTAGETGCDFNLLSEWNAPFIPDVIYAVPAPALGAWTGRGEEGSSPDQDNDELSSPGYV